MSDWISVEDRLPDVEGEYLVAYRSAYNREWQYLLDEWGSTDADDDSPCYWFSDGVGLPKIEYWLDFPRVEK